MAINHLWVLMSATPFLRFPKRLVKSTCRRLRSRSFRSDVKWEGKRTCRGGEEGKEEGETKRKEGKGGKEQGKGREGGIIIPAAKLFRMHNPGCLQRAFHNSLYHVHVYLGYSCLPFQRQFFHRFGWAGQRRREDSQQPSRRSALLVPTSPPPCYNPREGGREGRKEKKE